MRILSFILHFVAVCSASYHGYLTFNPTTSSFGFLCPEVYNSYGLQAVSLNAPQFNTSACGKCINVTSSMPSNIIKKKAIVTNVQPFGSEGDLEAPLPGRTGVAKVSWDWTECD